MRALFQGVPPPREWLVLATAFAVGACASPPPGSSPADAGAPDAPVTHHALHFDGQLDYATAGTAQFPLADAAQTISMWIRYAQSASTQAFITLRRDNEAGTQFGIRNGGIAAWTVFGDRILVKTPTLPTANQWHHVAYVFDPNLPNWTATLYVDGAVAAAAGAIPNNLTPYSCWLGSYDGETNMYAGDLDEVRIWNVVRTPAGIVQDMKGQVDPASPNLVTYFSCDALTAPLRVPDDSGNGNDMTLGGGDPTRSPSLIPSTVP